MKKIFYLISHAYIAVTIVGGFACLYGIYEKYHALSQLQAFNAQTLNLLYGFIPFF